MRSSTGSTASGGEGLTFFSGSGLFFVILNLGGGNDGSLLLVGDGNDVGGGTEALGEVCNTGVGEGVVAPLPGEDVLEVATGLKALDNHLDLEVGNTSDVVVGLEVAVLLDDNDAFLEEVCENRSLFILAYEYHDFFSQNVIQ